MPTESLVDLKKDERCIELDTEPTELERDLVNAVCSPKLEGMVNELVRDLKSDVRSIEVVARPTDSVRDLVNELCSFIADTVPIDAPKATIRPFK